MIFPACRAGWPGLNRNAQERDALRSNVKECVRAHPVLAVVLLIGGCLVAAGRARGQGPNHGASKFYPDSSEKAETLMHNAASLARDSQWSEAIEIYQRIIDQYGDKVAKLPRTNKGPAHPIADEFLLFVDLRAYCHRAIATLPPEARVIYRNRMDSLAEALVPGKEQPGEMAPCFGPSSSWLSVARGAMTALELLGDMAFQEGRFGEALSMYRPLVPDQPVDAMGLTYPDPTVDLAQIAAKKLFVGLPPAKGSRLPRNWRLSTKVFPGPQGSHGPQGIVRQDSRGIASG